MDRIDVQPSIRMDNGVIEIVNYDIVIFAKLLYRIQQRLQLVELMFKI
jgi:hypothetical protein